jgi:hypothetical protein
MTAIDDRKKARKQQARRAGNVAPSTEEPLSAAQMAVNEQMRRVLEEDAYSALGSIVDTDTDDENSNDVKSPSDPCRSRRLDRNAIVAGMRKRLWLERINGTPGSSVVTDDDDAKRSNKKRKKAVVSLAPPPPSSRRKDDEIEGKRSVFPSLEGTGGEHDDELDRDEGSIFGQTTGASNATWVECDKCKKVCCTQ